MFLQTFIMLLFRVFQIAIFARVLLSWGGPSMNYSNPLFRFVYQITEPILAPIRRFAVFGMIDFSPFVALIALQLLESALLSAL